MATILDDTTKFLKIGDLSFDDTHKLKIKLQKWFLELFKKKFISREVYELIHPFSSQRPRMYGLPKIHKSDIPFRPILSIYHSVQHSLVKWLIQLLNYKDGVVDWCIVLVEIPLTRFEECWPLPTKSLPELP